MNATVTLLTYRIRIYHIFSVVMEQEQLLPREPLRPGGRLNKKDGLTGYGNSHVKDKTS